MQASYSTLHTIIGLISPFLSHGFMKTITLRVYESCFLFLLSKFSRVLVAKLLEQGYPPFRFLMNPPEYKPPLRTVVNRRSETPYLVVVALDPCSLDQFKNLLCNPTARTLDPCCSRSVLEV